QYALDNHRQRGHGAGDAATGIADHNDVISAVGAADRVERQRWTNARRRRNLLRIIGLVLPALDGLAIVEPLIAQRSAGRFDTDRSRSAKENILALGLFGNGRRSDPLRAIDENGVIIKVAEDNVRHA